MQIRCTLPNCSDLISGVRFSPATDGRGVVSEEIDAEVAQRFLRIPGFARIDGTGPARRGPKRQPKARSTGDDA